MPNPEETKFHPNQTANVRPRVTEPVQFITSPTAANSKAGGVHLLQPVTTRRSSDASDQDNDTNLENVMGHMIQNVLETSFNADFDGDNCSITRNQI